MEVEAHLTDHTLHDKGFYNTLLCVITGKGDKRALFDQKVQRLENENKLGKRVSVKTIWLKIGENRHFDIRSILSYFCVGFVMVFPIDFYQRIIQWC